MLQNESTLTHFVALFTFLLARPTENRANNFGIDIAIYENVISNTKKGEWL